MMQLPILYKFTTKGAAQQWQIITKDNTFYTIEGQVGGKLTTSLPTVCTGKNIGKKNETSDSEQAYLEAVAKWTKKKDKGYAETIGDAGAKYFEPMLAFEYAKYPIDWDKVESKEITLFAQPKLDGIRAINHGYKLESRYGKPLTGTPHLLHDLEDLILDGELYNHQFHNDFNKISSVVKKQTPTEEQLKESEEVIEHWVYDMPSHPGKFWDRFKALAALWQGKKLPKGIKLVPTVLVNSLEELIELHDKFKADGYEGTILRTNSLYENKRSKNLLKFKDFIDEEFEIIGYEEGKGGRVGTVGFFWCWLDKSKPYVISQTKPINCFKSNVKGDFGYLRDIWDNVESYIGKSGTVKYFNRTPTKSDGTGNVPRFPYIIKINREEYE